MRPRKEEKRIGEGDGNAENEQEQKKRMGKGY